MTPRVRTKISFTDPDRASRNLQYLLDAVVASGSRKTPAEFEESLQVHLSSSPDPDMALNNLTRFSEATLSRATFFDDVLAYPMLMDVLVKLFGHSQYFADILVRDPELFRWLTATDSLLRERSNEYYKSEVDRALSLFESPRRVLDAFRRLYRREVVRIGARDILDETDLEMLTRELSYLADALIEGCCQVAHRQLAERFPAIPLTPYAVLALGKLGGEELNYSSDIDLLFVYRDEGEVVDGNGRVRTYHEYFNDFMVKVIQNLSESSGEGHLYRVDMRLRPESGAGPIARSLGSYLAYYESRGELWERQMLIKGRPVAGSVEFGQEFLRMLDPFVYPRTMIQSPVDSIARMKAKIEAAVSGSENVKLRPGGIRDVEFIVQGLQLLNGGRNPDVREHNTLRALALLNKSDLLSASEKDSLASSYVFLRRLEHRLQMVDNMQTHELPGKKEELEILARRMGKESAPSLQRDYSEVIRQVRRIFDRVFAGTEPEHAGLESVTDGASSKSEISAVIERYGFKSVNRAAANLTEILTGATLTGKQEVDGRGRDAFRGIAETLFGEMSSTPSPDMTLENLALLVRGHRFPELLYRQLAEENYRRLIIAICAISPRVVKGLRQDPLLLEMISSDHAVLAGNFNGPLFSSGPLAQRMRRRELIIAVRNILGLTDFEGMALELTSLADEVIGETWGEDSVADKSAVILALGKFGSSEITIGSDLDLIFLSGPTRVARRNAIERAASGLITRLGEVGEWGRMYEIDARLRPEGKSAPLVTDIRAYEQYLSVRASLWERQSLLRARVVVGDPALAEEVIALIRKFVYEMPLPKGWIRSITEMRRATEKRSHVKSRGVIDIKLGPGGMVDIEFLAQCLLLAHGAAMGKPLGLSTAKALQVTSALALSSGELDHLVETYGMLRKLEKLLRLTLEQSGTVLPEGDGFGRIACCAGFDGDQQLREKVETGMRETRKLFLTIMGRIGQDT